MQLMVKFGPAQEPSYSPACRSPQSLVFPELEDNTIRLPEKICCFSVNPIAPRAHLVPAPARLDRDSHHRSCGVFVGLEPHTWNR